MTFGNKNLKLQENTKFLPHCRRHPPQQSHLHFKFAPLILISVIIGFLILLPLGVENTSVFLSPTDKDNICSAFSLIQTIDRGFAIAGATSPDKGYFCPSAIWLIKTNVNGLSEWNKTYRLGLDEDISASSLVQVSHGEFAIAGQIQRNLKSFFLKTNAVGWPKNFQIYEGGGASALIQTTDGGFALASSTNYPENDRCFTSLMKVDTTGKLGWINIFEGIVSGFAYSLIRTTDGGFAFVGRADSYGIGEDDFWLVKTDVNGIAQWNRTYGESGNEDATSLIQTVDRGFLLIGNTDSFGEGNDTWLIKTDESGIVQWNKTYRGFYLIDPARKSHGTRTVSIISTPDGGFALAGTSWIGWGLFINTWLVKTDRNGDVQWHQSFGGSEQTGIKALISTADGGFAIAGDYCRKIWLMKTNGNGVVQWNKTYGTPDPEIFELTSPITLTPILEAKLKFLPILAVPIIITGLERIRCERIK
ncbi:MAG: hypothetical protein ACXACU_06425 [Candidatus Hodarchaeales archaeon]|jgi:hypothetical protein